MTKGTTDPTPYDLAVVECLVEQLEMDVATRLEERMTSQHAVVPVEAGQLPMTSYFPHLLEIVMDDPTVLQRLPEPIQLASGEFSRDFIDGKHAVDDPDDLAVVGKAMFAAARETGVEFDAVGGLVLGAVPFTFAVAQAAQCKWFLIRKEPKGRGTNRWVEGARITPGLRVMLVDDVVSTGGSIEDAYKRVQAEGGEVVFATTLVDRSDSASEFFKSVKVPYRPMLTYRDLNIEPVGHGSRASTTTR